MQYQHMLSRAIIALSLALTCPNLYANVVLEIDVSDPANVKIVATGNPASTNGSSSVFSGVYLGGFFAAPTTLANQVISGSTLTPSGVSVPYINKAASSTDLQLFTQVVGDGVDAIQDFSTAVSAFTGMATIDLSSTSLPAAGTSGQVYITPDFVVVEPCFDIGMKYTDDPFACGCFEGGSFVSEGPITCELVVRDISIPGGVPIGTWSAVPEPSAFAFLGLIGLVAGGRSWWKRRR